MNPLEWHNLIFLLPLAWPALYILMLAFGLSLGETDVDADHGVDAEADADVHAEGELGSPAAGAHGVGPLDHVLDFFGIGKAPVSILGMSCCFLWAMTGMTCNLLLPRFRADAERNAWTSMAIAGAVALLGTRWFGRVIAKFIPSVESYGASKRDLLGLTAEVLHEITPTSGNARLRDQYGNLLDVACRIAQGDENIPAGSKVVLLRYDEATDLFAAAKA